MYMTTNRCAVLVAPGVGYLVGTFSTAADLKVFHSDRKANGEAWPGERLVRVPRRIGNFSRWMDLLLGVDA